MKTSCPGHVWTGQVWTDLLFSLFISFENAHHADRIVKILEAAVDLHIAESFLQCVHRQVRAEANLIQKHCEKCDWMTGKQAGQNFHENRAKFDQKSPFNIVRASGDRDSACFPMQDYGARRSDRWWKRAEGKQVVVVVGEGREKI